MLPSGNHIALLLSFAFYGTERLLSGVIIFVAAVCCLLLFGVNNTQYGDGDISNSLGVYSLGGPH